MIEFKVNKGKAMVHLDGSATDITAETMVAIRGIWDAFRDKDANIPADYFKEMMTEHLDMVFDEDVDLKGNRKDKDDEKKCDKHECECECDQNEDDAEDELDKLIGLLDKIENVLGKMK